MFNFSPNANMYIEEERQIDNMTNFDHFRTLVEIAVRYLDLEIWLHIQIQIP